MIKRVLWLGIGIAVGVLVVRKASQAVQAYSPTSIASRAQNSAAGLLESVRDFVADVREGMAEREDDILTAFERGVSLEELDQMKARGVDDEDGVGYRR